MESPSRLLRYATEICMKMKEFGPQGSVHSWRPPLDTPVDISVHRSGSKGFLSQSHVPRVAALCTPNRLQWVWYTTATQKRRYHTCPHAAVLCTPNRLRWVCCVLRTGYDESGTCTATQKRRYRTCPHAAVLCTLNHTKENCGTKWESCGLHLVVEFINNQ